MYDENIKRIKVQQITETVKQAMGFSDSIFDIVRFWFSSIHEISDIRDS